MIGGDKSDTWLAANLDNLFRDWVDDDECAGRAAGEAYAELLNVERHGLPHSRLDVVRPVGDCGQHAGHPLLEAGVVGHVVDAHAGRGVRAWGGREWLASAVHR